MTRSEFFQYLQSPEKLDSGSLTKLEKIVAEYPWFQSGRLLHLKGLHNQDDIAYEKQLGLASVYAPGGTMLYDLIRKRPKPAEVEKDSASPVKKAEATEETKTPLPIKEPIAKSPELEFLEEEIEKSAKAAALTMELLKEHDSADLNEPVVKEEDSSIKAAPEKKINPNDSHSFAEWLRVVSGKEADPKLQQLKEDKTLKNELINKFILHEAARAKDKPKAEFYSAEKMAQKSLTDDETFVSETLAKIYLRQGNLPKAQKAYEILMVKHPEKIHIFAPLLEKIKKLREEQKNR